MKKSHTSTLLAHKERRRYNLSYALEIFALRSPTDYKPERL
jgi:hypothetical protein